MTIRVFYHTDLDGYCAGGIVKLKEPEAIMYPINYGYDFPWDDIKKDDTVYMVDFALQPFEQMLKLKDMCHLIWIDHHASVLKEAEKYREMAAVPGIRMNGVAACVLTWRECFPKGDLPLAAELIGNYDVWNLSNPITLPFQYGMRIKETDPAKDMSWWKTLLINPRSMWVGEIVNDGEIILEYEGQKNAEYMKAYSFETYLMVEEEIPGDEKRTQTGRYKVIAVNVGRGSSKMFESVWDQDKYALMVTFCRLASQRWTVSLYATDPAFDCGSIAKAFGGGGHKGAAGFQCDELPFEY